MNKVEVREKLWKVIRQMLLTNLEMEQEIPDIVSDFILEDHGWTIERKIQSDSSTSLNIFSKTLQKWIDDMHLLLYDSSSQTAETVVNDLSGVFEAYLAAESEYLSVTSQLIENLKEIMKHKERYSLHFKNKCRAKENNVEVLSGKAQLLKLQFLLKHYNEGNALRSHLKLHQSLRNELETLKQNYSKMLELNESYRQMEDNKYFMELHKIYQELRKIEKRVEIIGTM